MHFIHSGRKLSDLSLTVLLLLSELLGIFIMVLAQIVEALSEASDLILKRAEILLLRPPHDKFLHELLYLFIHGFDSKSNFKKFNSLTTVDFINYI